MSEISVAAYLGDGVYARSDGFRIWLSTDRDGHTARIALEPSVYVALRKYARTVWLKEAVDP